MALATLSQIRQHLLIASGDTSQDTALTQWLSQVSTAIRSHLGGQYVGGVIQAATAANPTVITCAGHGLETGDSITIAHSNTTPTIDGARTVTRLTDDTFTVPVTVTVAGTAGTFARSYTEYYDGTGQREFQLAQRPVLSITSLYEDPSAARGQATDAFAASTLLTAGTDYSFSGLTGWVTRLNGVWTRPTYRDAGMLVGYPGSSNGSIKVTYVAGYVTIPADIVLACCQMVAECRRTAPAGAALQSESFYGYSYSLQSGADAVEQLTSAKRLLAKYKPIVI